jgi:hypothetical protein
VKPLTSLALAVVFAAAGLYGTIVDDKPGTLYVGALLMMAGVVLGVRAARAWWPGWALRTALVVGIVVAASAAFLIHRAVVTGPLFAESQAVPSVVDAAPAPPFAPAVERARTLVRAAVMEQNLPGVSVAVGVGNVVVWAEGFGWRDVLTRTPVTPRTRFDIGTASAAVSAGAAPLGLTDTGTDSVTDWSPGHIGEPEEDFPGFTFIRRMIFKPLGLAPDHPLPGDRATYYVPRSDGDLHSGRRLMFMRDLSCCANRTAFYSTPSDLVRFAMATHPGNIDGSLAGGSVMSLVTSRDRGIDVAVTSNIAFANTSSLAQRIVDAFAQ